MLTLAMVKSVDRNEKGLAIVIATERYKERDRKITLLSPLWGLVSVTVYGAQKAVKAIKAPLYTEGIFSLYNAKERNALSLVDINPISIHENALSSLEASFASSLFSELIIMQRGEDAPSLFELFTTALDHLNEENWRIVSIQFILRYLSLIGLGTDFISCPVCMRKYTSDEILGFSSALNVPCCKNCDTMNGTFILPPNARSYLRDSLTVPFERAMAFSLSVEMSQRLLRYLIRFSSYALGRELKVVKSGLLNSFTIS